MRQAAPSITGNRESRMMWLAWLIAGTLDLLAAVIQTLIAERNPLAMLKFIASGVFGRDALTGGHVYAVAGALFHYMIAWIWTWFFFWLYAKWKFLRGNMWMTGVIYGILVWFVMNRIVLPLSNTPSFAFSIKGALISCAILIVAIGLPLSMIAKKYTSAN